MQSPYSTFIKLYYPKQSKKNISIFRIKYEKFKIFEMLHNCFLQFIQAHKPSRWMRSIVKMLKERQKLPQFCQYGSANFKKAAEKTDAKNFLPNLYLCQKNILVRNGFKSLSDSIALSDYNIPLPPPPVLPVTFLQVSKLYYWNKNCGCLDIN